MVHLDLVEIMTVTVGTMLRGARRAAPSSSVSEGISYSIISALVHSPVRVDAEG